QTGCGFDRFKTVETSILSSMTPLLDSDALGRSLKRFFFDGGPPIMPLTVRPEFRSGQPGPGDVFGINDHQLFALRVEEMDQPDIGHALRQHEPTTPNERKNVLQIRSWSHSFVCCAYPCVDVKIHAADICMCR